MASHGKGLKRRAFSLGAANAINCALQLLLPVVLVRYLDREVFGEYRLLWLAVGTIMAVAPVDVPDSLYYFLPRSEQMLKRLYVNQTLLFLAAVGLVSGWAVKHPAWTVIRGVTCGGQKEVTSWILNGSRFSLRIQEYPVCW